MAGFNNKRPMSRAETMRKIYAEGVRRDKEMQASAMTDRVNKKTYVRTVQKVGRNEKCPCKSGLKYKKCHGQLL